MATYKNISDNWFIDLDGGNGTIYVNGSVDVTGNITTVSDLAVDDAFIIVAANNTGTVGNMGMVAQKTSTTFAGLRFNTTTSQWEISPTVYANGADVGTTYQAIATGNGSAFVAGTDTQIQFNQAGGFGASGNLFFDYSNNVFKVQGVSVLGNVGATPTAPSNAVAIYNNTQGVGGTGLYVVGSSPAINNDELVSVTKARLMAIIY